MLDIDDTLLFIKYDTRQTVIFAGLYTKGLIYIDVPIADDDYIVGKKLYNHVIREQGKRLIFAVILRKIMKTLMHTQVAIKVNTVKNKYTAT